MKPFLIKSVEIFCKCWLGLAALIALLFCGIIGFIGWLINPTSSEADPEEQAQEWENWFGAILLFVLAGGSYFLFTVIG